jgi:high affinity sulfate transporter 1
LVQSFRQYKKEYFINDLISGIVVALISIPISMGYAQVAGLPLVYGLYGSMLPIIVFGLISSSPQFVFGVDAAPAALTGGTIAALGIATGSDEAMRVVPVITLVTALWLLLFAIFRAGKLVNYISKPVLGGFISGIASTIILMQVAKLFGGNAGTGEIVELVIHIVGQFGSFNLLSFIMGVGTVIIILVSKKISPKFPMSVVMLVVGGLSTVIFHVDRYGVKLLPKVEAGLPRFKMVDFGVILENPQDIIMGSLTIALVIVSSTLLTASNYAIKNDYKINNNREIIGYCAANLVAAFTGCCPLNGSVSRTAIAEQFGVKSQVMSLVAGVTMAFVLLFGTPLIAYLPVPVLTGIVIAALIGILEIGLAKKLWKTDRTEFAIFMAAFAGVLIFGTIYGVMIGVVLSFVSVIIKASVPPRSRMGVIPGEVGFYNLSRNRRAHPIKNTVIYRFNGALFFANIGVFQSDIEAAAAEEGVTTIIVDAGGISSVDTTAADRLVIIADKLRKKNISFYITEHADTVNDQLRKLGAGSLVEEGVVRRTISLALRDAGVEYGNVDNDNIITTKNKDIPVESNEALAEIEWAFGDDADEIMEKMAVEVATQMAASDNADETLVKEAEKNIRWGRIGLFDESELLDRIEMHLSDIVNNGKISQKQAEQLIEQRRSEVEHKLDNINPDALEAIQNHRRKVALYMKENNPTAYAHLEQLRKRHIEALRKTDPALAGKLERLYGYNEE